MEIKNNTNTTNNEKRLRCTLYLCAHNTACCAVPHSGADNYCKKTNNAKDVRYRTKYSSIDKKRRGVCDYFILDKNKKIMCADCQIKENGTINMEILNMDAEREILEYRKSKMQNMIEDGDNFPNE